MTVPETTVHKNDSFVFRQDNIRFPGELAIVSRIHREAIAHAMKEGTDQNLRLRIFVPNTAHVPGAAFRGEMVHGNSRELSF